MGSTKGVDAESHGVASWHTVAGPGVRFGPGGRAVGQARRRQRRNEACHMREGCAASPR
jgi:hypothetical protein